MAEITDDQVVLLERTLQTNKEVIAENKKLQDEIKSRDQEHSKVLHDVLKELQELKENRRNSGNREQSRLPRKKQKLQVPPSCRRTLRKVYSTLSEKDDFSGFHLEESVNSAANSEVLKRVKDEIYHYVGGQDRCAWSDAQIEEAFSRYFLSYYETVKKKNSGKYEDHKRKCRRQSRKREKLGRRTLALEKVNWSKEKKGQVAEVLTEDYMSSEESSNEDDQLSYVVKTITWESERLKKRKKLLDKTHAKTQTKHSRQRFVKRVREEGMVSVRGKPEDCPEWACV